MHSSSARRGSVAAALCLAISLLAAGPAAAGVRATAKVHSSSAGTRLEVKVARKGSLSTSQRPRAVSVKTGGKTYKLKKPKARTGLGTWKSKRYRGATGSRLAALSGKKIRVVVRSRSGSKTLRPRVTGVAQVPGAPGGGGGETAPPPASGPFEKPSGELTGEAAFAHIQRYFVNSRFTDCPAGWPNCAVEEQYNHCAGGGQTGNQEYHRYTPTSGSDINSYGEYQVTGAAAHPDGSWGVEYNWYGYGTQSFYSWNIAADGTVTGTYRNPSGELSQIGPLRWQQPAGC